MKNNKKLPNAAEVLKLHDKRKQTKALPIANSELLETLDDEKAAKQSAEMCATKLREVFMSLKEKHPLKENFNLYSFDVPEWRKEIKEFLKKGKDDMEDKMKLFWYLRDSFEAFWLSMSRPSASYFDPSSSMDSAYLELSFKDGDEIREKYIDDKAKECSDDFIKMLETFKQNHPDDKEELKLNSIDIQNNTIMREFFDEAEYNEYDIWKLFDTINEKLWEKWYRLCFPAISYFRELKDGQGSPAWLRIVPLSDNKIAA
mgnify:FL=1